MDAIPSKDDRTVIQTRLEPIELAVDLDPTIDCVGNALPTGTLLGEFELLEIIGEGGFGIVYLAMDHSLQRRVAIKEYMPQALARRDQTTVVVRSQRNMDSFQAGLNSFINEAQLLAKFDHPSLVKVHRFWKDNGTAYMVMPLYSGPTLRTELKRRKDAAIPVDETWLLSLLDALTQALAVMHADNCYHRDIAPDNILLLEGSGKPLLLDFGAARTVISDLTQSLTVILKPGYAPIEQYAEIADMKQGAWTDVYALASSIHFAIRGVTPPAAVGRLVNDSYVPLATPRHVGYSDRFLTAIDRSLQVRPADRTPSMDAFRLSLGLSAITVKSAESTRKPPEGYQIEPHEATRIEQPSNLPKKSHFSVPMFVLGCVLFAGVGVFLYWQLVARSPETIAFKPTTNTQSSRDGALAVSVTSSDASTPSDSVVVPSAPAIKSIKARLEEVLAAQTPNFRVAADPIRPSLRIDKDTLSFNVTSDRDGYVQVLWLNADQKLTVLLPNKLIEKVQIFAGQTLRLPPKELKLIAAPPQGREYLLVIVSSHMRDFSTLSQKQVDGFVQLNTETADSVRKNGQPALSGVTGACPAQDCQDYGATIFSIDVIP
jgi:serine/threonine protein kinase